MNFKEYINQRYPYRFLLTYKIFNKMSYSKEAVKNQLSATKERLQESIEYYRDFLSYLKSSMPLPTADAPAGSERLQTDIIRWSALCDNTKHSIKTADQQLQDIDFHLRILDGWR